MKLHFSRYSIPKCWTNYAFDKLINFESCVPAVSRGAHCCWIQTKACQAKGPGISLLSEWKCPSTIKSLYLATCLLTILLYISDRTSTAIQISVTLAWSWAQYYVYTILAIKIYYASPNFLELNTKEALFSLLPQLYDLHFWEVHIVNITMWTSHTAGGL